MNTEITETNIYPLRTSELLAINPIMDKPQLPLTPEERQELSDYETPLFTELEKLLVFQPKPILFILTTLSQKRVGNNLCKHTRKLIQK
jgi:hypothetical protein